MYYSQSAPCPESSLKYLKNSLTNWHRLETAFLSYLLLAFNTGLGMLRWENINFRQASAPPALVHKSDLEQTTHTLDAADFDTLHEPECRAVVLTFAFHCQTQIVLIFCRDKPLAPITTAPHNSSPSGVWPLLGCVPEPTQSQQLICKTHERSRKPNGNSTFEWFVHSPNATHQWVKSGGHGSNPAVGAQWPSADGVTSGWELLL